MRQLRQTLRLLLDSGLSLRECSQALGMPKSTVGDAVRMARVAGVDWVLGDNHLCRSDDERDCRW